MILSRCQGFPRSPCSDALLQKIFRYTDGIKLKDTVYGRKDALVLKEDGDVIGRRDIVDCKDLISVNLTGIGDFDDCLVFERSLAAASNLEGFITNQLNKAGV